jgi:general secretion pathway protein B
MSSILKSLKKLEEEKSGHKHGSSNVSRDILKGDVPRRKSKSKFPWVLMVLLVAFAVGAVLFLRSPAPVPMAATAPAAVIAPAPVPALPAGEQGNQAPTAANKDAATAVPTAQEVVSASKETAEALKTTAAALQDTAEVLKDKVMVPKEAVVAAPAPAKPKKVSKPASKPVAAPAKDVAASEPQEKIDLAAAFPAPPPKIKLVPVPAEARSSVWSLANQKGSTKPVLKVSEIHWRKDVRERLAVVNELPVMEGVVIDGAKVDRIFKDRIRFVVNGQYQEVLVSAQR